MQRFFDASIAIALVLWVGALWSVGFIVAPTLFSELAADRALAGALAGRLFALVAWIGIVVASVAMLHQLVREGLRTFRTALFWLLVAMLLLTLAGQFGVAPILAQLKLDALPREVMESVLRNRFMAWHGVSSVLYLMQSALGLWLLLRLLRR